MIYGVLNKSFSNFINTGSSRIKTGSRKYERDTPLPSSHPISIFTDKYGNKWKKYRNTDSAGWDFIRPFSSLPDKDKKEKSFRFHKATDRWRRAGWLENSKLMGPNFAGQNLRMESISKPTHHFPWAHHSVMNRLLPACRIPGTKTQYNWSYLIGSEKKIIFIWFVLCFKIIFLKNSIKMHIYTHRHACTLIFMNVGTHILPLYINT